jgi:hypothetical protein
MSITKKQLLEAALRGEGPLGKAADDEPVFLLRAQDNLAADFVDQWVIQAGLLVPVTGSEATGHKIQEAREIANAMRSWPIRKNPD